MVVGFPTNLNPIEIICITKPDHQWSCNIAILILTILCIIPSIVSKSRRKVSYWLGYVGELLFTSIFSRTMLSGRFSYPEIVYIQEQRFEILVDWHRTQGSISNVSHNACPLSGQSLWTMNICRFFLEYALQGRTGGLPVVDHKEVVTVCTDQIYLHQSFYFEILLSMGWIFMLLIPLWCFCAHAHLHK